MKTPKQNQSFLKPTQSGFTLIESLVAIIIVSVLMVSIAPVIALSVATRVQARRVEIATQAARNYIDAVRADMLTAKLEPDGTLTTDKNLLPQAAKPLNQSIPQLRLRFPTQFAAPPATALTNCPNTLPNYPYCRNIRTLSLYCVDLDGGGCQSTSSKDMVVQAFRSTDPKNADDNGINGFLLGARVYRADAFKDGTPLQTTKDRVDAGGSAGPSKVRTYTGGSGDRKAPLVEMTTEIRTNKTDYKNLCDRLGGCTSTSPTPTPTP
ncbi:MAG TPA: hormogonium polysaccharide secretion pseudopilin HpsB [Allocoleopsis sp.]